MRRTSLRAGDRQRLYRKRRSVDPLPSAPASTLVEPAYDAPREARDHRQRQPYCQPGVMRRPPQAVARTLVSGPYLTKKVSVVATAATAMKTRYFSASIRLRVFTLGKIEKGEGRGLHDPSYSLKYPASVR